MNININELKNNKTIHMIGINGISMSGLAEILLSSGYTVTGSDLKSSDRTEHLKKLGAVIYENHDPSNIQNAGLVVYTAAVHQDNPEIIRTKELKIPLMERSVLLGLLMSCFEDGIAISGTHGKTTTTAMITNIFIKAGLDPTVHIGAYYKDINGTVRTGSDRYFITEACEYCESFLTLHPKCAVITNIDFDHADYYKDIDAVKKAFVKFSKNVTPDGFLILNGDCLNTLDVMEVMPGRKVTFGFYDRNTYQAVDMAQEEEGTAFSIKKGENIIARIRLKVSGQHNVMNALSAFVCGYEYNISVHLIQEALESFKGTGRRFEYKGTFRNAAVYDDYAHHPTEIQATLTGTSLLAKGNVWCVFQPHTYTRTITLSHELASALSLSDKCIVTDIYAAREKDTGLIHSRTIVDMINQKKDCAVYIKSFDKIVEYLGQHVQDHDVIIVMGAGDIEKVAAKLVETP